MAFSILKSLSLIPTLQGWRLWRFGAETSSDDDPLSTFEDPNFCQAYWYGERGAYEVGISTTKPGGSRDEGLELPRWNYWNKMMDVTSLGLGGGCKYFFKYFFMPILGNDPIWQAYFAKWVETTNYSWKGLPNPGFQSPVRIVTCLGLGIPKKKREKTSFYDDCILGVLLPTSIRFV